MKTKAPLISVIITNYNYEKFIGEAIESVLNQTYENIELIVIDDGSTDGSRDVIKKYEKDYPDIRILLQENKGVVPTRNRGLKEARGEFLIFIDADDTIPVNFIAGMYDAMNIAEADVVYCNLALSGKYDGIIETSTQSRKNFIRFLPTPICQLIRKEVIGDTIFDSRLNGLAHEDNDFFFALYLKKAKFSKASVLYNYRVHEGGRSPDVDSDKHYRARVYLYKKYLKIDPKLIDEVLDGIIDISRESIEWHKVADNRLEMIRNLENKVLRNDEQIANIYNSKRYAIGSAILYPISIMKKISKGGK